MEDEQFKVIRSKIISFSIEQNMYNKLKLKLKAEGYTMTEGLNRLIDRYINEEEY